MTIDMPAVVADYFNADYAHDADGLAACFGADGEVRDEHQRHQGHDAIRAWKRATGSKYAASVAPLDCTPTARGCVVKGKVSGNFPGSPVVLAFDFQIDAGRIHVLDIK